MDEETFRVLYIAKMRHRKTTQKASYYSPPKEARPRPTGVLRNPNRAVSSSVCYVQYHFYHKILIFYNQNIFLFLIQ
jgi:hypothetical protein